MIRRSLKCDIQGYQYPKLSSLGDETLEIIHRAQVVKDLLVPTFTCANCPWAAVITRLRLGIVVRAFAECAADGVNRRQVDHVESHVGDIAQTFFAIRKGSGRW